MGKKISSNYKVGDVVKNFTILDVTKNKWGQTSFVVKCTCGCVGMRNPSAMKNATGKGCGKCFKGTPPSQKTHGETLTRVYRIWCSMRRRCHKIKDRQYPDYGGRGIVVCDEWRNSYESFRNWALANGYSSDLSIDRIDNNGNYEPSNCRWATDEVQCNNKRNNVYYEIDGVSKTVPQWQRHLGITRNIIDRRIKRGYDPEFSIFTPVTKGGSDLRGLYQEYLKNKES